MSLTDLMRHTCDVYSPDYGRDTSGRTTTSYTLETASLPCNVQPAPSSVIEEYRQRSERVTYSLYWISDVEIGISHRVVYDGDNYRVVGTKRDTQRGTWRRADLEIEQS